MHLGVMEWIASQNLASKVQGGRGGGDGGGWSGVCGRGGGGGDL